MKKIFLIYLFSSSAGILFAQQQTFDLFTYTPLKGWKAKPQQDLMAYSITNNAKGSWAQIALYRSTASKGSIESDFTSEWGELAAKQYSATGLEANEPITAGDWKIKTGGGKFRYNNADAVILLTTMTGYNSCVSILATTNSQDYISAIQTFMETVDLKKPSGDNKSTQQVNTDNKPVLPGKFSFTTTNFNDGWNSVEKANWIEVTKGDMTVLLWYGLPYNGSNFSGTGVRARDYYWDNYVASYFSVETKQYNDNGEVMASFQPDYVEGWAKDKTTGQRRFIAMRLSIAPNAAFIVIASAKNESLLRQQFPKANDKYTSDLANMSSYNKFAVGKSDLTGTWGDSGGGTVSWYSTTTGQYAGATGAAVSDRFVFNANGSYSSEHKGGYGVVGALNTYQQKYNGVYTVNNWQVTASKRWEGKTENFDAWFEVVRGGRMLHLSNANGKSYTLFRER